MDQFNKAISFILGLVVVAVFIAIASGRINLKNKLPLFAKSTPTPALSITPIPTTITEKKQTSLFGNLFNFNKPKPSSTPTPVQKKIVPTIVTIGTVNNSSGGITYPKNQTGAIGNNNNSVEYHSYSNVENVSNIPSTGPSMILPLIFSSLAGGIYLKRKSGKE